MSDFLGTAETSMISSFVAEKSLKYGSNITKEKSFRINPLPYNKLAATSTSHFMESSSNPQISGALKNSSPTATNIKKQPQHLHGTEIVSPIKGSPVVQSSSGITAGIRSHGGVAGLGNLYKTSALPITMSDDALLKYLERKGLKAQQQRLDSRRSYTSSDAVAAMYSMLIPFNPNEFASIVPLRGTEALKAREKIFVGQTFEESDAVMILQGWCYLSLVTSRIYTLYLHPSSTRFTITIDVISLPRCAFAPPPSNPSHITNNILSHALFPLFPLPPSPF